MRIVNFKKGGVPTLGVKVGEDLVDLSIADKKLPKDLGSLIAAGKGVMNAANRAAKNAPARAVVKGRVSYLPPIMDPPKIICVGLNYKAHADEADMQYPKDPVLFNRFPTTLVGHKQAMIRPKISKHFDYEGEMVVFIGKKGRHITKKDALNHVAGYSIFNEGSIRDYQMKSSQWTVGKNFDATGGFGPEFVSADELPKGAKGLDIQTRLNGKVVQDSNTKNMIFDVATLISYCSKAFTLLPGDIIVSGTPEGVGFVRKPPLFMKNGDTCEVEIEGLGILSNPIKNEK